MSTEAMLLRDPEFVLTTELLKKELGKNLFSVYEELNKLITEEFGLNSVWNYYKDGKAWLCKVVNGKKTVFWISAWDGYIKTSFYFTERTRVGVTNLEIDDRINKEFEKVKAVGKLVPLILDIDRKEQLKDLVKIIKYKKSLK